jgi:hypothetical protein
MAGSAKGTGVLIRDTALRSDDAVLHTITEARQVHLVEAHPEHASAVAPRSRRVV